MTHPPEGVGDVLAYRRGDENLLDAGGHLGEGGAARAVEFGEHVVEQQDGFEAVLAEQTERAEPEREGERPRLAVAREALRGLVAEAEEEVVAMGADQTEAALELVVAPAGELGQEGRLDEGGVGEIGLVGSCRAGAAGTGGAPLPRAETIRQRRGPRLGREPVVRLDHMGTEVAEHGDAIGHHPRAELGEPAVPHLEGVERRARLGGPPPAQGRGRRLDQGIALAEDARVVGEYRRVRGPALGLQVVEQAAPLPRLAADEREILGGEQHGLHHSEQVGEPPAGRGVEPRTVGLALVDRQFRGQLTAPVVGQRPDQRGLRPGPDERRIPRDPVRTERGQHGHGLEHVGLAVAVAADEGGHARLEVEFEQRPRAEVDQAQPAQVHARTPSGQPGRRTGMSRYV